MANQTATQTRQTPRQTPSRPVSGRPTPGRARAKQGENTPVRPFQMPFDAKNMRIIALGIAVIVIGYVVMYVSPVMSDMALTVSPILLLLGYCVIVPMGIMAGVRRKRSSGTEIAEPTTNGVA
jgi:hypothetical protein